MGRNNLLSNNKIHHSGKTLPSWIGSLWFPARLVGSDRILPFGAVFEVQLAPRAGKAVANNPWLPAIIADKHYAEPSLIYLRWKLGIADIHVTAVCLLQLLPWNMSDEHLSPFLLLATVPVTWLKS